MGSGVTAPCIHNLGTTFRRNFSFILLWKGPGILSSNGRPVGSTAPIGGLFKITQWDLQGRLGSVQNKPVGPSAPVWTLFIRSLSVFCALRGKLRLLSQTEISVSKSVTVLTELPTSNMHMPSLMPRFPRRPYLQSHSHSRYQHHNVQTQTNLVSFPLIKLPYKLRNSVFVK
jgi:hypothetical protein